jgi:hypothetical protein
MLCNIILLSDIMLFVEGTVFKQKLRKSGGSYFLPIPPEAILYLRLENNEEGDFLVVCKADKGKHGRFIGFGKPDIDLSTVEEKGD